MRPMEKRVLELVDAKHAELVSVTERYDKLIAEAKAKVESCTHPAEAHAPFEWEHDNGYGRQTRCTGVRCRVCGKSNMYPGISGSWH